MNTTSFQTTHYNHAHQVKIQGQSNLKIFDGEDLTSGDRKRLQQLQSNHWLNQQMQEKERNTNMKKLQSNMFDQQTLQITEHRKQLQQEKAKRLRDMEIAYRQNNLQQLDQKLNKDRLNRDLDTQEKLQHINYINNNDFYTENPNTCQSMLSRNRVLPYHWKGMNAEQRQAIMDEQAKQIQQKKLKKDIEKEQDRLFAEQMEAQRKALVLGDRAKNKGGQNMRKGMDEYNKLKAEEMKKKAFQAYDGVQTYKNE